MELNLQEGILITLLFWFVTSFAIYFVATKIQKKYVTSPSFWWGCLFISIMPLLPLPYQLVEQTIPAVLTLPTFYLVENYVSSQSIPVSHTRIGDFILGFVVFIYIAVVLCKLWLLRKQCQQLNVLLSKGRIWTVDKQTKKAIILSSTHSPFVYGFFKPVIALPNYFPTLSVEQQQILMQHELTHIEHNDHRSVFIWRIIAILFWINPSIRKYEVAYIKSMEHRCDYFTVNVNQINPTEYAKTLLTCLGYTKMSSFSESGIAYFSDLGLSMNDYKQRFTWLFHSKTLESKVIYSLAAISFLSIAAFKLHALPLIHKSSELSWHLPVSNIKISSNFDDVHKVRKLKPHKGTDFMAIEGTAVFSTLSGKVKIADAKSLHANYGNVVLVQHRNGYQTLYAHLSEIKVKEGQWLTKGELLGNVGKTGKATGPHLHFEVFQRQTRIDPMTVLGK